MQEDINLKLFGLRDKIRVHNKNKASLASLAEQIKKEETVFFYLKEKLTKEYHDVEKLEGMSLAGIFQSILGNREERYEKEKKEYLEAKLKYDNSIETLRILKSRKEEVERALREAGDPEKEYEALLKEKEKILLASQGERSVKLNETINKEESLKLSLNEMNEAVTAGGELQSTLIKIIDSLESAQGWGTWDIFGGGLIATSVKHGKIEEARSYIASAQVQMNRFSKELADTGERSDLTIEIGSFEKFADFFFDNFITDMLVQSKINSSLDHTRSVYGKVMGIMDMLRERKDKLDGELKAALSIHNAILSEE